MDVAATVRPPCFFHLWWIRRPRPLLLCLLQSTRTRRGNAASREEDGRSNDEKEFHHEGFFASSVTKKSGSTDTLGPPEVSEESKKVKPEWTVDKLPEEFRWLRSAEGEVLRSAEVVSCLACYPPHSPNNYLRTSQWDDNCAEHRQMQGCSRTQVEIKEYLGDNRLILLACLVMKYIAPYIGCMGIRPFLTWCKLTVPTTR